mgnify:CR=1 FL=1
MCILARHMDYVAPLGMGQAIVEANGKRRSAACIGGMVSVLGGQVKLVPTTFEWADEIDEKRAESALDRAQERLRVKDPKTDIARAQTALLRAMARINAAK